MPGGSSSRRPTASWAPTSLRPCSKYFCLALNPVRSGGYSPDTSGPPIQHSGLHRSGPFSTQEESLIMGRLCFFSHGLVLGTRHAPIVPSPKVPSPQPSWGPSRLSLCVALQFFPQVPHPCESGGNCQPPTSCSVGLGHPMSIRSLSSPCLVPGCHVCKRYSAPAPSI